MTETVVAILISIAVFTLIILVLVSVLMFAAAKLIRQDDCKILINDDEEKSPTVKAGSMLLNALADSGIYLPSACGGCNISCPPCVWPDNVSGTPASASASKA